MKTLAKVVCKMTIREEGNKYVVTLPKDQRCLEDLKKRMSAEIVTG